MRAVDNFSLAFYDKLFVKDNISEGKIMPNLPVADTYTPSEKGLKAYINGRIAATFQGDVPGAVSYFEKAVEEDDNFALAQ